MRTIHHAYFPNHARIRSENAMPFLVLPIVLILASVSAGAQEEETVLYGRERITLSGGMFDSLGFSTETLLKGDWRPSESVRFHLEGEYTGSWGTANRFARAAGEGLPSPDPALFPFKDFHSEFLLSQAWTSFASGPVDLTAGKQPLAWGTGYLFNPTSALYPPRFPGEDLEEVASTTAVAVSAALPLGFGVSGYLAFEDRFRSGGSFLTEGKPDRLPFGVKIASKTDLLDASVSFSREVPSFSAPVTVERLGADAAGTLFELGWYAEGALRLPKRADGSFDLGAVSFADDLSFCAGGFWTLPSTEVTLRSEYAHLGDGERDKARYDWAGLLSGRRALLAEDYLFLSVEWTFLNDWKADAAGLVNLNEGGTAVLGGLAWAPESAVEIELGGMYYAGPTGGELDGKPPVPGLSSADLTRPEIHLSLTVFF